MKTASQKFSLGTASVIAFLFGCTSKHHVEHTTKTRPKLSPEDIKKLETEMKKMAAAQ